MSIRNAVHLEEGVNGRLSAYSCVSRISIIKVALGSYSTLFKMLVTWNMSYRDFYLNLGKKTGAVQPVAGPKKICRLSVLVFLKNMAKNHFKVFEKFFIFLS